MTSQGLLQLLTLLLLHALSFSPTLCVKSFEVSKKKIYCETLWIHSIRYVVEKNSCFVKLLLLAVGQILPAVPLFLMRSRSTEMHMDSSGFTSEQFEAEFSPLYLIA